MKWIDIKKEWPKEKTYFWAFILGRPEQGIGNRSQRDHNIILLYMDHNRSDIKKGEARSLDVARAYWFPQEEDPYGGCITIIAWLPFEDMILPDNLMEYTKEDSK